jgi:ceramide glucosyltransferase
MVGGMLAAVVYSLLAGFAVMRFPLSRRGPGRPADVPSVSVLKPVRGFDPLRYDGAGVGDDLRRDLAANLSSFFIQDYPGAFELLFGFQEPDDPAIGLVEDLCRRHPHVRTRIVRVPEASGPNRKASVLAALVRLAEGEILVASDQDMRVDDRYLDAVVAPFDDEAVGAVTCPYRTRWCYDLGGALEALTIAVDFIPSTLVARMLDGGLSFALGATMAIRRRTLDAIGGFAGLEPYLADDYLLGNRTFQAGWRVEMSPYVVDNVVPPTSLRQYFGHQLRWSRGYRVCRPLGYFFSILMNGTGFALGALALLGAPALKLLAAWLVFRALVASFLFRRVAGRRMPWSWLALVPIKDLASLVLWSLAIGGNRVEWGGRRFTLTSDGRLVP